MANVPIDLILKAADLLHQRDAGEESSSQNQVENNSESDTDSDSDDMEETESNTPGDGNASNRARVGQKRKVSSSRGTSRGRKTSEGQYREEGLRQDAGEKHNQKERERRKDLKQAVARLRNQLRRPTKKPSTIRVLNAAQQEIQALKSSAEKEEQELDAQKKKFTFLTWRLEKAMTDYKEASQLRPNPSPASAPINPFYLPPSHPGHRMLHMVPSPPGHVASFEGPPAMHTAVGYMIPSSPPFPFSPSPITPLPAYRSPPHIFTVPPRHPYMIPHMSTMHGHRFVSPTALYSLPHAPNYPIPMWNPAAAVVRPALPYIQQEAPTYNYSPSEVETKARDTENSLVTENGNSSSSHHGHSVIRWTMSQASLQCSRTCTLPASTSEEDIVVDVVRSPDEEVEGEPIEYQTQLIEQTDNCDHRDQNSIRTEEVYSRECNQDYRHKCPKNFPDPPALRRAGVDTDAAVVSKIIEQVRPQRELLSQRAISHALEKHAPFITDIDSGDMLWHSEEKHFNSNLKRRRGKRNGLKHRVREVPVLS